jgi:hypothetical protein
VYNQLLYVPVRAGKTSFSNVKNGLGHFIKAVVTRNKSGTENANDHTRERWAQLSDTHIAAINSIYGIYETN